MTNPWVLAARPRTLWAAVVPVAIGGALAHHDGALRWDVLVVTLLTALLIQIAVNYANDASDAVRGADEGRIGPQRAVASGLVTSRQMWRGVALVLALAVVGGLYLAWVAGWVVIAIGAASIVALLGYTGGPVPYGYRGLGEVFVFAFFGPVATVGSRYVHDSTATSAVWWMSVPIGLLAVALLIVNNLRDVDTDAAAGKRTLAVRLGRPATRVLLAVVVGTAFVVLALTAAIEWVPRRAAFALAAAPLAVGPVWTAATRVDGPQLIRALGGIARTQLVFGALATVGIALA